MEAQIEIRPGPASFAPRSPSAVESELGESARRSSSGWTLESADGGAVEIRLELGGDELRAVHLSYPGEGAEREALALAARLAARLNWSVVDAAGVARSAAQTRRQLRGRLGALRAGLTLLGGAMAVVFGFAWAAQRGTARAWLLLTLLGMLLYAAMRCWGWLERRLGVRSTSREAGGMKR